MPTGDADNSGDGVSFDSTYSNPGYVFTGAAGRQFDFGLRVEGEVGYRQASIDKANIQGMSFTADGNTSALSFMANAFYDFDLGMKLKPYIGGGLGFARVSVNDFSIAGTALADDSDTVFAYQAGAGLGYAVTQQLTAFVEYRYFATLDPNIDVIGGGRYQTTFQSNNVQLGLRYNF